MRLVLSLVLLLVVLSGVPAQKRSAWKEERADLLFTSTRDGNSEIYLLREGQKEWINLSNNKAGDNWPVWSRNGTRIALRDQPSGKSGYLEPTVASKFQLTSDPEDRWRQGQH